VFSHILNPVKLEVMAGQFHAPSHPGVLKKIKYEWEHSSEIFFAHKISRGANNCGQDVLEKKKTFIS